MLRTLALMAFATLPLTACQKDGSVPAPAPAQTADSQPAEKPAKKLAETPTDVAPAKPAEKPKPAAGADKPPADEPAAEKKPESVDAAVAAMRDFIAQQKIDTKKSSWRTKLPLPPKVAFTAGRKYYWDLGTSEGPIRVLLNPEVAPMHVSSTIYLSELGFYDGLSFHRVIPGFMAQGGCPVGNGTGSPGYKYAGEFSPKVKHDRAGLLSMANAGPGTDGSQFFLTFVPTPTLDGKHTIFGEVVAGMETLKTLESFGSKPAGQTKKPLTIQSAKVVVE